MILQRLGDIAEFINGVAFKPEDWGIEGKKIIRIQNLTNQSKAYNYTTREVDDKYIVRRGDVLVSWSATIDVFTWDDEDALVNQHIFKVVFDNSKVVKPYFIFALKKTIDELSKFAHGSTMKHVVKKDFDNHRIPLPSLQDQLHIANILSKAEALISQRKESLRLLDEFLKSTFLEMFGDPVRNEKGWETKTMNDIATQITDGEHATPIRTESGVKLLSARNIRDGYLDFEVGLDFIGDDEYERISKRCNPERGDILMSCSGSVGRVSLVNTDEPFSLVRSVALIKLKRKDVIPLYIQSWMQTTHFQNEVKKGAKTSSQSNIFTGAIKKLPVLIPPIKFQTQFAHIVEKTEALKTHYQTSLQELENLYGSLSQRAFRGELSYQGNVDLASIRKANY